MSSLHCVFSMLVLCWGPAKYHHKSANRAQSVETTINLPWMIYPGCVNSAGQAVRTVREAPDQTTIGGSGLLTGRVLRMLHSNASCRSILCLGKIRLSL